MRFPLRAKFFLFATLLATAPLALVGQNLVRIARDELEERRQRGPDPVRRRPRRATSTPPCTAAG